MLESSRLLPSRAEPSEASLKQSGPTSQQPLLGHGSLCPASAQWQVARVRLAHGNE